MDLNSPSAANVSSLAETLTIVDCRHGITGRVKEFRILYHSCLSVGTVLKRNDGQFFSKNTPQILEVRA